MHLQLSNTLTQSYRRSLIRANGFLFKEHFTILGAKTFRSSSNFSGFNLNCCKRNAGQKFSILEQANEIRLFFAPNKVFLTENLFFADRSSFLQTLLKISNRICLLVSAMFIKFANMRVNTAFFS